MALDGKAIKEEIPDKDIYETNLRRAKDKELQIRAPDSPESARAVAPRSPISPKNHHTNLTALSRTTNGTTSPIQKGSAATPPLASSASTSHATTPVLLPDPSRELNKLRKFFGALYQFGQDTSAECGDRVRSLILSLVSGGLTTEEFKQTLQESVNFPLRPYVLPFLKSHIPILQRDLSNLAKASNQSTLQYIRSNESSVFEFVHTTSSESSSADIFMPIESSALLGSSLSGKSSNSDRHQTTINGGTRLSLKRRTSEGLYDHQNGPHDSWSDYMIQSKRSHLMMSAAANGHLFPNYPPLFDYSTTGPPSHVEAFSNILDKQNNQMRDERDMRTVNSVSNGSNSALVGSTNDIIHRSGSSSNSLGTSANTCPSVGVSNAGGAGSGGGSVGIAGSSASSVAQTNRLGGEEEWKNIHTMLNCISAMVDKTKRAITILQQRGVESTTVSQLSYQQTTDTSIAEMKRQTEEKVAEFRRNAEEAVNQVKRQAVIEIQRAVAAAENRAVEAMAQERIKLEKMFQELHKTSADDSVDRLSPPVVGTQNVCWNCGRKANETCSGCNLARYCGAFCQHKDWEQHHQVCGTSRVDSNGHKHVNVAAAVASTRASQSVKIPPARTSPSSIQQQQQQQPAQQQLSQQSSSINITNTSNNNNNNNGNGTNISSATGVK